MTKKRRQGEAMRVSGYALGILDSVKENTGWKNGKALDFIAELAGCTLDFSGCDPGRVQVLLELYRATVVHHDCEQIAVKQIGKTARKVREIKARIKTRLADTLGTPPTRYRPKTEIDADSAAARGLTV